MTGLGSSHGYLHRLVITHFTKKDHIRALAQGSTQCRDIILGINIDLTLAYDTPVVSVKEFQRILQCDDVLVIVFVDMVDDARKGSGFPASGRSCDQYHSFGKICKTDDLFRDTERSRIRQSKGNDTDHDGQGASLFECADAET